MPTSYPHIVLPGAPEKFPFKTVSTGGSNQKILPPNPDRHSHSSFLKKKLEQAWMETESEYIAHHAVRSGVYLEFKENPGFDLVTKSLEDMRSKKIRLLNVRKEKPFSGDEPESTSPVKPITFATVYVANEKRDFFFDKIQEYATQNQSPGKPKNQKLINSISSIRKALAIKAFWVDAEFLIPGKESQWCEVWLSSDSEEIRKRFDRTLGALQIKSKPGFIRFPERLVKVIQANSDQLEQLTLHSDDIAEFRSAKEIAGFWIDMKNVEQADWVQELMERTRFRPDPEVSVCLLDTGVNNGHSLLSPVLSDDDCQSVDLNWGRHDHDKHGSLMAGVAAYGDMVACLSASDPVEIHHCLESVKILPLPPKETEPDLWGDMTAQGVYRAQIQAPDRTRIVCMAVSAADTRDQGRPSSWSGKIDQLASGSEDDIRRLLVICSGNINDLNIAKNYPHAQITDSIHDPGQSWNALTVGAYTSLDEIKDPDMAGFEPIAPKECLSPFTTTSSLWDEEWPIKPEIVMEGGNLAKDPYGFVSECGDLSVLSTYYKPLEAHFYPFNMTSAATAKAAWFAAQIQTNYPGFWPETIRALMVHSARWTDNLKQQFGTNDKDKMSLRRLMRICGYGVPDLSRALHSASNSLTLIAQEEIQPYDKKNGTSGYKTKDMHLHDLPWPREELLNLPFNTDVEMRITLSYFIEPGAGEIGWKDRYRYPSHGLRFHLNSPGESKKDFINRINTATRDEDEGKPDTKSAYDHWLIGKQSRDKGSIHSDIWKGTAAELAASNMISVSPTIGWWRERSHLGKWNKKTRYALIVSITTSDETVDIYTPVVNKIGIQVPAEIST